MARGKASDGWTFFEAGHDRWAFSLATTSSPLMTLATRRETTPESNGGFGKSRIFHDDFGFHIIS